MGLSAIRLSIQLIDDVYHIYTRPSHGTQLYNETEYRYRRLKAIMLCFMATPDPKFQTS